MKTETSSYGVLLILPPFGSLQAPYISLAVLSGYLKSCAIPVSVFNAAAFLAKTYCQPSRIQTGIKAINQSFRDLNNKRQLDPSEAAKLTIIYPLLNDIDHYGPDGLPPETTLQVAAFPFWPDCLIKRPLLKLASNYSIFDSNDLLLTAGKEYFFTAVLQEELKRKIDETGPRIVGISAVFDEHMPAAMHCARLIKEIAPDIHVTMGGPFITTHMDELDNPHFFSLVDSLIFDEGEIPLMRLYEELGAATPDLEKVPGLMYLSDGHLIRKNPSAPAPDMETLAYADYPACSLDQYPSAARDMQLTVRLSRGCYWQKCTFCRVNLSFCKNYQQPSIDRILGEIQHIAENTGVRDFLFSDESSHPLVLEKLSQKIIDSKLHIEWSFHTRIDQKLTRERVSLYKEAGCKGFQVGIETFNNRLLKVLQKGITEELIIQVLEQIQGILPVHAYMIVGIPGETAQEADRSFAFSQDCREKDLLQGASFFLFQLMPGSDMWNHPGKYRIRPLQSSPGQDLKPNICAGFVVEDGMSRDEAFAHFIRYNFPDFASWKKQGHLLTVDGETLSCRYPFGYLQEILGDSLIYQNDLPFQPWLTFLDAKHGPIIPFKSQE